MYRQYHRFVGAIAVVPLLLTITTGLAYRWSVDVFGVSKQQVKFLLKIHQGSIVSSGFPVLYTACLFLLLLWMAFTGLGMIRFSGFWRRLTLLLHGAPTGVGGRFRQIHQLTSPAAVFVCLIVSLTGVSYRWSRSVLHFEKESVAWLLVVHTGAITPHISAVFTAVVWLCLASQICSGAVLWLSSRTRLDTISTSH